MPLMCLVLRVAQSCSSSSVLAYNVTKLYIQMCTVQYHGRIKRSQKCFNPPQYLRVFQNLVIISLVTVFITGFLFLFILLA